MAQNTVGALDNLDHLHARIDEAGLTRHQEQVAFDTLLGAVSTLVDPVEWAACVERSLELARQRKP